MNKGKASSGRTPVPSVARMAQYVSPEPDRWLFSGLETPSEIIRDLLRTFTSYLFKKSVYRQTWPALQDGDLTKCQIDKGIASLTLPPHMVT